MINIHSVSVRWRENPPMCTFVFSPSFAMELCEPQLSYSEIPLLITTVNSFTPKQSYIATWLCCLYHLWHHRGKCQQTFLMNWYTVVELRIWHTESSESKQATKDKRKGARRKFWNDCRKKKFRSKFWLLSLHQIKIVYSTFLCLILRKSCYRVKQNCFF